MWEEKQWGQNLSYPYMRTPRTLGFYQEALRESEGKSSIVPLLKQINNHWYQSSISADILLTTTTMKTQQSPRRL